MENNECKTTCASGQYRVSSGSLTPLRCVFSWAYYYEWNATSGLKRCVQSCDDKLHFIGSDNMCGPSCESKRYSKSRGNRLCAESCSDYQASYPIESDGNAVYTYCADKCPDDQSYYLPNKTCIVSCPIDYNYVYSKSCLDSCDQSQYYYDNADMKGYYTCSSTRCPTYAVEPQGKHCVSRCPADRPYLDPQRGVWECKDRCLSKLYSTDSRLDNQYVCQTTCLYYLEPNVSVESHQCVRECYDISDSFVNNKTREC